MNSPTIYGDISMVGTGTVTWTTMRPGYLVEAYWWIRGNVPFVMVGYSDREEECGSWAWWDRGSPDRLKLQATVMEPITEEVFERQLELFHSSGALGKPSSATTWAGDRSS